MDAHTMIHNYKQVMFAAVETNGLDPEDPRIKSAINNGLASICIWVQHALEEIESLRGFIRTGLPGYVVPRRSGPPWCPQAEDGTTSARVREDLDAQLEAVVTELTGVGIVDIDDADDTEALQAHILGETGLPPEVYMDTLVQALQLTQRQTGLLTLFLGCVLNGVPNVPPAIELFCHRALDRVDS